MKMANHISKMKQYQPCVMVFSKPSSTVTIKIHRWWLTVKKTATGAARLPFTVV
jgi:hypothetical protein